MSNVIFKEGTHKKGGMNADPDPNYVPPKPKSFRNSSEKDKIIAELKRNLKEANKTIDNKESKIKTLNSSIISYQNIVVRLNSLLSNVRSIIEEEIGE